MPDENTDIVRSEELEADITFEDLPELPPINVNPASDATNTGNVGGMTARAKFAAGVARLTSSIARKPFGRTPGNKPGVIAKRLDPNILQSLASTVDTRIIITGTNGKTSTTNLMANAVYNSGARVLCNRAGNNMETGIISAIADARVEQPEEPSLRVSKPVGVFECDELWCRHVVPVLKPYMLLLLNLFRDQLDRAGETEKVQDAIADALRNSPETVLVYNADDPLCVAVADNVSNRKVPFSFAEKIPTSIETAMSATSESKHCPKCGNALQYEFVQYAQIGRWSCPECGCGTYTRGRLSDGYVATSPQIIDGSTEMTVTGPSLHSEVIRVGNPGVYSAYNILGAYTAMHAMCLNIDVETFQRTVDVYHPDNGRQQIFNIGDNIVETSLAKNPIGLSQSLTLMIESGYNFCCIFINDNDADGHDVSWLWDVDLSMIPDTMIIYAGGTRANDLQVRLKYAGISSVVVNNIMEALSDAQYCGEFDGRLYAVANYTALPKLCSDLTTLASSDATIDSVAAGDSSCASWDPMVRNNGRHINIVHLLPDLLNLYGDNGNVEILRRRFERRGYNVSVVEVRDGDTLDLSETDLVFIGGGADREQAIAANILQASREELKRYIEDGGVVLAICGGYQLLGRSYETSAGIVDGIGVIDMYTAFGSPRLVGQCVVDSPLVSRPVIGFENHAGRTTLGGDVTAFGTVVSGSGNNGTDGTEGAVVGNVIGTYLHGPLLAKNPELADAIIKLMVRRRYGDEVASTLPPLDDLEEVQANRVMFQRIVGK